MTASPFAELLSYHDLLVSPDQQSPGKWALLSIAERYARRALKAADGPLLAALPRAAQAEYTDLRNALRKTSGTATHWNERVAQVCQAVGLLQPVMG